MRASHWLLGLGTVSLVAGAIAVGCGGSTNNGSTQSSDASTDVTTDVVQVPEAAPEAAPASCPIDGGIESFPVPDASIGDSGASASACVSCVETACPTLIQQCDQSCACKEAFQGFEQCVAAGGSLLTCGQGLAQNADAGISLTSCPTVIVCATTCGVSIPTGGDGGSGDAGSSSSDGGSDDGSASSDAGAASDASGD